MKTAHSGMSPADARLERLSDFYGPECFRVGGSLTRAEFITFARGAVNEMRRVRLLGLALVPVFALAAIATGAASAEHPPLWISGGSPLPAGHVLPILGSGLVQNFKNSVQSIQCRHASFTGSVWNEAHMGQGEAPILFSECLVYKGAKLPPETGATLLNECTVEDTTLKVPGSFLPIVSTLLVYLSATAAAGNKIGALFAPAAGNAPNFVTLNFTSTGTGAGKCKQSGTTNAVGSVVAHIEPNGISEPGWGEPVEGLSGTRGFPTTAIGQYWNWGLGDVLTEGKASIKVFGSDLATDSGEVSVHDEAGVELGAGG
jgi:hypothetical protein